MGMAMHQYYRVHHIAAYLNWKLFGGRASAGNIRWKIRVGKIFTQNTSSVHFGWKKCCFWFSNCNYNMCIFSYYVAHCVSSHFTHMGKKAIFWCVKYDEKKKKLQQSGVIIDWLHQIIVIQNCAPWFCVLNSEQKNYRSNISDVLETRMIQKTDRINTFLNCQEYHRVLRNSK